MFNTDINIDTYIYYSNNSMLAITKDTAYNKHPSRRWRVCVEECSSWQVISDSDGNKCGTC